MKLTRAQAAAIKRFRAGELLFDDPYQLSYRWADGSRMVARTLNALWAAGLVRCNKHPEMGTPAWAKRSRTYRIDNRYVWMATETAPEPPESPSNDSGVQGHTDTP